MVLALCLTLSRKPLLCRFFSAFAGLTIIEVTSWTMFFVRSSQFGWPSFANTARIASQRNLGYIAPGVFDVRLET